MAGKKQKYKQKRIYIAEENVHVFVNEHVDEAQVRERFKNRRAFNDFEVAGKLADGYAEGIFNKRFGRNYE